MIFRDFSGSPSDSLRPVCEALKFPNGDMAPSEGLARSAYPGKRLP
jgi:hypothetical protein